ncbi:MAG TPA: M20/M25/M40 family metallo-hydrolase [Thermoanaerobaculia bacterium]|nr:M20/M25/M40 family metallo-hydrolase [Thermoanaerobaculia bacterium]
MPYSALERRRRTMARRALYGSLLLVTAAVGGAWAVFQRPMAALGDMTWHEVAWDQDPVVRLLQQYVRVDSTPAGDELAAALLLATPLEAAGLEVHVERLGERHANLWAELPGEDPQALVLLSHLDVEPIHPRERWAEPPFAAVLDPPWLLGRGTFDMKSYAVAQVMALLRLAAEHPRPARTVRLIASSGEEQGSDLGVRWLLRERPELFADVWAVLTEGGVLEARALGNPKYWGTEFAQKQYVELRACSGSRERLEALERDVRELGLPLAPLRLPPEVAAFWQQYAPSRDREDLRQLVAAPQRPLREVQEFLALPKYLRSMLRDELVPMGIEEAAGGGYELRLLVHLLPGGDLEAALARLLPDWMTHGVTVLRHEVATAAAGSPLEHPAYLTLQQVLRQEHPELRTGPFLLPWTATDCRFLRLQEIPCYGFTPFFILTPDTLHVGSANERISLPGLRQGADLYERLVARLAAGPGLRGG